MILDKETVCRKIIKAKGCIGIRLQCHECPFQESTSCYIAKRKGSMENVAKRELKEILKKKKLALLKEILL